MATDRCNRSRYDRDGKTQDTQELTVLINCCNLSYNNFIATKKTTSSSSRSSSGSSSISSMVYSLLGLSGAVLPPPRVPKKVNFDRDENDHRSLRMPHAGLCSGVDTGVPIATEGAF